LTAGSLLYSGYSEIPLQQSIKYRISNFACQMKNSRKLVFCLPIFILPALASYFTELPSHSEKVAATDILVLDTLLPDLENELFAASGVCVQCHGYDTLEVASVDAMGHDINVVDDWRSTMMGNAAKDPFWKAKVSHEVQVFPQHQVAIEDKCVSCHAPLGSFNAKHIGQAHYGMADLDTDEIGKDGVSCLACHQISPDSLGLLFSGLVRYDTFEVAYGPYQNPLVSPMLTETGYKPYYSDHISDSGICASCHTLQTETIDDNGNLTGNIFTEQATYHEWQNSIFNDSVSCQACHMPSLEKWPVILISGAQTKARTPFSEHEFVGGNVTMLKLLQGNIEPLGLKASSDQFGETIAKTENLLKNRTLEIALNLTDRTLDTAMFSVKLVNLAGHKFPSGYPSRRAFIEFMVKSEDGDTLFISGKTDSEFEVLGQNPTFEPHYETITSEDQVQIYEMVMGDVNNDVTTVLERADHPIKDNRLPPMGFTNSHPVYDTTLIAGTALNDQDFNKENDIEGSGSDVVFYHIPMGGHTEVLEISAKVFYQPTPPKWMKEMFDHSTSDIDSFRDMFAAADRAPILLSEATVFAEALTDSKEAAKPAIFATVFPVPSTDGKLYIRADQPHSLRVFTINGRQVLSKDNAMREYNIQLPGEGVFTLRFTNIKGEIQIEKIVINY